VRVYLRDKEKVNRDNLPTSSTTERE